MRGMLRCWWRKRINSVLQTPENRKPAAPFVCCRFRAALHWSNPCTMTSSSALSFFYFGGIFIEFPFILPEIIPLRFSISFAKEPCLFYTTKTVGSSQQDGRRTRAIRSSNSLQSYFFKLFHVPLWMCHNSLPGHGCLPCGPAAETHLC